MKKIHLASALIAVALPLLPASPAMANDVSTSVSGCKATWTDSSNKLSVTDSTTKEHCVAAIFLSNGKGFWSVSKWGVAASYTGTTSSTVPVSSKAKSGYLTENSKYTIRVYRMKSESTDTPSASNSASFYA